MVAIESVTRFAALFRGCKSAFGTYDLTNPQPDERGKLKGVAKTLREPLALDHYRGHLEGRAAIGVIPIDEQNHTSFGAIDVDSYSIDHADLARRIKRQGLPLIVARSKSGGAHLLLFAAEPIPAGMVIGRLKAMAAALGVAGSEIFPKQSAVNWANGDVGSWINLSYFNGTLGARYAISGVTGEALDLQEFLSYAEARRQPAQWFKEPLATPSRAGVELKGAPPCLQTLVQIGVGPGQRNQTALALGVYFKKAQPADWKFALEKANRELLSPALPDDEMSDLIRSLKRKDYGYSCKTEPLASHCNRRVCLTCAHGVGGGSADVVLTHIRILETEPPNYFISVENHDKPLECDLESLWDHAKFQRVAMTALRVYPQPKKRADWAPEITALLQKAESIPAPLETSEAGRIQMFLENFCGGRARGMSRDELLIGRPYTEKGRTYFRSCDFESFPRKNRVVITPSKLWMVVRGLGGDQHRGWKLKGKSINVWSWPLPKDAEQVEAFELPSELTAERRAF